MDSPLLWIIIGLVIFFFIREIMLWYWRINDIIKNQEAQLDLMDAIINELTIQSRQLKKIIDENTQKQTNKEESTP